MRQSIMYKINLFGGSVVYYVFVTVADEPELDSFLPNTFLISWLLPPLFSVFFPSSYLSIFSLQFV